MDSLSIYTWARTIYGAVKYVSVNPEQVTIMNKILPLRFDRSIPLVDAILQIIEGTGTETEALQMLLDAESDSEVKFVVNKPSELLELIPLERYQELVEPRINRFLTQTHLVLGSNEYSRLEVLIAENYKYMWAHREWAHMLASWANRNQWLGYNQWNYLDFYGGLNDKVVENYNAWCEVAMRLIELRSRLAS